MVIWSDAGRILQVQLARPWHAQLEKRIRRLLECRLDCHFRKPDNRLCIATSRDDGLYPPLVCITEVAAIRPVHHLDSQCIRIKACTESLCDNMYPTI